MRFTDVPNLARFEEHARNHTNNEIVMDAYRRIREIILPAPKPPDPFNLMEGSVDDLKASCAAVEKATRIIWACAASTDNVLPPLWDNPPEYDGALDYFVNLPDLEIMAITKKHRIFWEQTLKQ